MQIRIWPGFCKLVQRQTYSCLSSHYGIWFAFAGLVCCIIAAFHFGEIALQMRSLTYLRSTYYDNIVNESFESRMCLPLPVDIVYTWVNGSDPKLIKELNAVKQALEKQMNASSEKIYADKKKRNKLINSDRFRWKRATICPVPNCVPSCKMAASGLPRNILLSQLQTIHKNLTWVKNVEFWEEDIDVAFLEFHSRDQLHQILNISLLYKKVPLNTSEVFYTSTVKNGYRKIAGSLMIYDVTSDISKDIIKSAVESKFPNSIASIELHHSEQIGIIHFVDSKYAVSLKELSRKNRFLIHNRVTKLFPVTYIWRPLTLSFNTLEDDLSKNRFADNNELKYSLRSVEQYAPWVRNIYIVTNGQVPSWLNLEHPRIRLVTHQEIFLNKSHLPTFSSPAIETHIHRIPGLSKKFIYMNDDVFFGLKVWPDDFYTHSNGQKLFLSWAVPNCHKGCPASWINDKYCDKSCNVSACDWDGGDCLGEKAKSASWQLGGGQNVGYSGQNLGEYCSGGCAHNWLGDRYCDGNCNNALCGYDAGDCGDKNLHKLFSIKIKGNSLTMVNIKAPLGCAAMYVNVSEVFSKVIDGNFEDNKVIRTAILSKKLKILSLTFFQNHSLVSIPFQVLGYKGENETVKDVVSFNISIDSNQPPLQQSINMSERKEDETNRAGELKVPKKMYNVTFQMKTPNSNNVKIHVPDNFNNTSLSENLRKRLKIIQKEYSDGELTDVGFHKRYFDIYKEHTGKNEMVHKLKFETHKGRKLMWLDPVKKTENDPSGDNALFSNPYTTVFSFLPWERKHYFKYFLELVKEVNAKTKYQASSVFRRRRLLDTFSSSLLHVSRIYNKEFGYLARKVPAHMPHFVDRDVISEMQSRFWTYFDTTSAHKIRHPEDMQFAFSYNYYMIGVKDNLNVSTVFENVDTDHSGGIASTFLGHLSDRELRSLAAVIYPLPLNLDVIKTMEAILKNCSKRLNQDRNDGLGSHGKKYYDREMPLVTKKLYLACHELWPPSNVTQDKLKRYKHEILGEDDIIFKMIRNNITYVLNQLDWIRKNRRKFICLNDDLDHAREDAKIIRSILKDFYESLFPIPSQFELPPDYKNRFLYKHEMDSWLAENRDKSIKRNIYVFLLIFILGIYLLRKTVYFIIRMLFRIFKFRRRSNNNISDI